MRILHLSAALFLLNFATQQVLAETPQDESELSVQRVSITKAASGDWPWWRGPNRNGTAEEGQQVPVRWNASTNIVWRTPVPGRGHSSPTVVGNRVYLTSAAEQQQIQAVVAFDRNSGKQLWLTHVSKGGFAESIHRKNTYATGTVASNGERIFVAFCNRETIQVTALTLDGKQIWQKRVGRFNPQQYKYGYAPSPLIYGSSVIVAADYEAEQGGFIVAIDQETGDEIWRHKRPTKLSFSSPMVGHVAGRDQLFISGCDLVASFDPESGEPLWSVPATTMATAGTMVWEGDLVFASGGYPTAGTFAIRADGSREIVWQNNQKCYEQSLLVSKGYVYAVTDQGVAYCWRAADGTEMWRTRLRGLFSVSPTLANGNIYVSNETGTMYVFKENPEKFELVAQNQLGDESFASPSICGDRIYLRVADSRSGQRQESLYCIGSE